MQRDQNLLYSVTFVNESLGQRTTIKVPANEYILDEAEAQGVVIPYSCRAGACVSCAGRILSGTLDQSDHNFLKDHELKAGFALLCVAYPASDCVIATHQEEALLNLGH